MTVSDRELIAIVSPMLLAIILAFIGDVFQSYILLALAFIIATVPYAILCALFFSHLMG